MNTSTPPPVRLFYSYAHEDEAYVKELKKHLIPLKRSGVIEDWHDRQIIAGEVWADIIDKKLNDADVILLLISPDFMASDYCHQKEMTRALERHDKGEAIVVPIMLRAAYIHGSPFARLQGLPKDFKPIRQWEDRDAAYLDVVQGLRLLIHNLQPIQDNLNPSVLQTSREPRLASAKSGRQLRGGAALALHKKGRTKMLKALRKLLSTSDNQSSTAEVSPYKTQYMPPPVGHTIQLCEWLEPQPDYPPKLAWARSAGLDYYGRWAELSVKMATQGFRWINPGTFWMGSPATEEERYDDETQHQVSLSQGYWLADTTCTQALWQAVTGTNPSWFKQDPNNSVERVSWNEVQDFIHKLNELFPDLAARLPTEAEWEYACRAGTITPFSYGENISPEQVNYDGKNPYHKSPMGFYRRKTVPVKSLPANPWGFHEMHGNVWEWCQDWFDDYGQTAVTDPTGPENGSDRVMRGGSWYDNGGFVRSAYRHRSGPDDREECIGFRLALGRGASR